MVNKDAAGLITFSIVVGAIALAIDIDKHKYAKGSIFDSLGNEGGINPNLLRAIHAVENPNNVKIPVRNTNGTSDYGLMQINERTFRHYEVPENLWLDDVMGVSIAVRYLNDTKKELGARFDLFNWISSYNQGVPNLIKKGIVNTSYVGKVYYHYTMYEIANA